MDSPPPPAGEMDFAPPPEISHPPPPRPLGPSSGKSTQRRADTWGDPDPSITSQRCRGWRPSCRCQNFDPTALCSDERCEKKKYHPALTTGLCTWGLTLWGWAMVPSRTGGWGPARQCCGGFVPARGAGPSSRFSSGNPASTSLLFGT